jgi:hypothetical protein
MYRVAVAWEDADGHLRNQDGRLEDRSRSGAGIFVNKGIPAGTRVQVQEKGGTHNGVVRHCRPDDSGYFIGIQFDKPLEAEPSPTEKARGAVASATRPSDPPEPVADKQ